MEKNIKNYYFCNKCGYTDTRNDSRKKIISFCEEWGENASIVLIKSNPTAERNIKICIDYLDGVSITDISNKYSISKTRVGQILNKKPFRKFIWQSFMEVRQIDGSIKRIRKISTAEHQKRELLDILSTF